MTGPQFRAHRKALGYSLAGMGRALGIPPGSYTARAVGAWEREERKIPPAVEKLLIILVAAAEL